jgi:16S rRNA (uracil1498-N3)-methyltransferase
MEYYYTPKEYISGSSLTIIDDEAKHVSRVLRKQPGKEIYVTDGEGNAYRTLITNVSKTLINCDVLEKFTMLNEPLRKVRLYQALLKNPDRFEFVIEKSVELGVSIIQPVITQNVINKTSDRTERWQSIALAAMKQSQRCVLPKVLSPLAFEECISSANSLLKLIADERADAKTVQPGNFGIIPESADLFIGPEGGFTLEEIKYAESKGFRILNLGPRKFRSETAAILGTGLILSN